MNIEQQAKDLEKLKLGALRAKYLTIFGAETKSNNRPYLIKKILQATQPRSDERTAAEPPTRPKSAKDATSSAKETTRERGGKRSTRDPRIPPVGTVLEREHDGQRIRAKVLDNGFLCKSKTYRSLSAIAKDSTGTTWNGLLFFGLTKRPKAAGAA